MTSSWWFWPLLLCLVMTGIHGYLGIHVLKRKVIFVDLAMAQIAALGAAYAIFLGYEPGEDGRAIHLFSLGATVLGAGVIALTRMRREKVPHEAFIGIVYACASALAILVLARARGGSEHLRHMLVGNLLAVTPATTSVVWTTAAIYGAVGLVHWIFRGPFFRISEDPEGAEKAGLRVRLWDFLFYASFGVVITSSVSVGGVLLVFSYLVVPGVIAVMFCERTGARLAAAWAAGAAVSVVGMVVSHEGDFDPGPAIVAAFAGALALAGLVHHLRAQERSGVAAGKLLAGAAVAGLALWGTTFLRKAPAPHEHHGDEFSRNVEDLRSGDVTRQIHAIDHLADAKDPHAAAEIVALLRTAASDDLIEHAAHALAKMQAVEAVPALREVAARDLDPALRVDLAEAVLDLRDPAGFAVLIDVLGKGPPAQVGRDARALIERRSGRTGDLEALRSWWAARGASLRWRGPARRFE